MRHVFVTAAVAALLLGACGKKEEGPDLRKPPPRPAAKPLEGVTTSRPGGTDAAAKPPPEPAPKSPEGTKPGEGAPAKPAVDVKVATPLQKTVDVTADYTGQTIGSETVEVRARVEGFLLSIHFQEGAFVKKGDLLYEIDREKIEEAVEQAEGELRVAQANEEKAAADVARNLPLVQKNAIAREEYDTSVSAQKAAQAKVEAVAAAVKRAKIQLGYATVRAPIGGLVGKTEVDVGNLVGRGEATLLTTISVLDPIYAEVRISEADVLDYQRARIEGKRGRDMQDLALYFSDGARHPGTGKIAVIDRNVDTKTGTLLVQVSFPNPDQRVRPGQFARVRAIRERLENALLVPQGCVDELQGTNRLYLLGAGDVVQVKQVTMGPKIGNLWVVEKGIVATDRVIVEGRQKVRGGSSARPIPVKIEEDGKVSGGDPNEGDAASDGSK